MLDPDAPSPDNPTRRFIVHWLAPNITQSSTDGSVRRLTNATENVVPYAAPAPPTTSSAHRYILYAFAQPDNFTVPEAFRNFSAKNRSNFNLTEFIAAASLSRPAAGEYFYVSRQTSVPADFVARAGGQYPGGNGNAIFVGSSTTTASSSSSGSRASATGESSASAQATSRASAGMTTGARKAAARIGSFSILWFIGLTGML